MKKSFLVLLSVISVIISGYPQETKKEYYSNGVLKAEYNEVKGAPEGIIKFYYETGEIQGELNYSDGKQNGSSILYHKSGNVLKQMTFKNDEQIDTMKIYYESGTLQELSIILNKKKDGIYLLYFENGQVQINGNVKDGQLHGYCEHYFENGKLEKKGEYYYGQPVGMWVESNEIGVTQKQYRTPSKPKIPESIHLEVFNSDEFSIMHPNSWAVVPNENPAIKFVAIPLTAEGVFKENMTLVVQPLEKNFERLDDFVDYANSSLGKRHQGFKIISDDRGENRRFHYRDVYYFMPKDLGYSMVSLKLWTRYFIINNKTYQITFSCEEENYDSIIKEAADIINSFKVK